MERTLRELLVLLPPCLFVVFYSSVYVLHKFRKGGCVEPPKKRMCRSFDVTKDRP
jgi:hypothetical protein